MNERIFNEENTYILQSQDSEIDIFGIKNKKYKQTDNKHE
jgi:hypothetical protein